jgi:hypothetical protein
MNITLAIDEELLERARALAARRGTSLNQMVRDLLQAETGMDGNEDRLQQLEQLWENSAGRSGGKTFRRQETYEERVP